MKRPRRVTYAISFECAGCHAGSPAKPTDLEALRAAALSGWQILKTVSWCPDCRRRNAEAVQPAERMAS